MTKKELIEILKDVPDEWEIVHRNPYDMVLDGKATWEEFYDFDLKINHEKKRVELP